MSRLVQVTVSLLQKALQPMGNALCLVDGFPRNIDNWMAWREQLQIAPHMTLILSAPEQILRERLMSRRGNRADDAEAVVGKRFKVVSTHCFHGSYRT
jgi:adenylate kinase family enzyme